MIWKKVHLIVRVKERLAKLQFDMVIGRRIVGERAPLPHLHKLEETKLCHVLRDSRRSHTYRVGQTRHRRLALNQCPKTSDSGKVCQGSEAFTSYRHLIIARHIEYLRTFMHT